MGRTQSRGGSYIKARVAGGFQQGERPEAVSIMIATKQHRQRQLFSFLKDREGPKDV